MSSAAIWKKAGFSINKYLTVSAKAVQSALKAEAKAKAEKRFATEVQSQILKDGEVKQIFNLSTGKEIPLN